MAQRGPVSDDTLRFNSANLRSPLCFAALLGLFLTVLAFVLGAWLLGLLLLPVALVLALVWASAVWDDLEPRLEETTFRTGDAVWRYARVVRVALTNWSRAGQVEVRMRAKEHQLHRQRDLLFRSLGEAVCNGNERLAADLKRSVASNNELIRQHEVQRRVAWHRAGERVEEERSATAPTQSFVVGERPECEAPPAP